MSGRQLFEKHGKRIKALIKIAKLFPKSFRKNRLAAACMSRGKIGQLKRYIWISTLAKHVGENVAIYPNVYFEHVEKLSLGSNVSIHQMCYIDAGGEIVIGNDVSIAHRTTVLSSNHRYSEQDTPIKYQGMIHDRTIIEENVWVGCGVTILAGVHIQSGSVVGANSVVTKDVGKDEIVAGNPSKFIKMRASTSIGSSNIIEDMDQSKCENV